MSTLTILNVLAKLDKTDRDFCQNEFERYWLLTQIEYDTNMHRIIQLSDLKLADNTLFIEGMKITEKWSKELHARLDELTRTFIRSVEEYFKTTHQLQFKTFEQNNPGIGLIEPLFNHKIIIHNILLQDGPTYFGRFLN